MNERYTNQTSREESPLFSTPNGNLFRLTTRGKIAIAAATLIIGVFGAKELSGSGEAPITAADSMTITVNPGVNLHTSPHMDSVDNPNVDYTVPAGEKIIVQNPLSTTTMGSTGDERWEGFRVPGVNGIQWINESQLMNSANLGAIEEQYNGDPGNSINVSGDGKGNYTFKTPDGSTHTAGTSEIVSSNP